MSFDIYMRLTERLSGLVCDPQPSTRAHLTMLGTSNDRYGEPYFTDGGIYSSLMAQSGHSERTPKYPQLVSFIGQTSL